MIRFRVLVGLLLLPFCLIGSDLMAEDNQKKASEPVKLWGGKAPGALGEAEHDAPTITPYLLSESDRAESGAAIVIFPGGGYGGLAGHEGHDYALWFNKIGVQAFVVKYRLGSKGYRHPVMLNDAARSVRYVRFHAERFGVNPERIGVIGSSAGGHLASTILTQFSSDEIEARKGDGIDAVSARPSFGILCYPVITMGPWTHQGSKRNLLGNKPSSDLVWRMSSENRVTPDTPPCFVWHTAEDLAVPVQNALLFTGALAKAGVPFDIHVYQKGRHGIGLMDKPPFDHPHPWASDLQFWLSQNGWL